MSLTYGCIYIVFGLFGAHLYGASPIYARIDNSREPMNKYSTILYLGLTLTQDLNYVHFCVPVYSISLRVNKKVGRAMFKKCLYFPYFK